MPLEDFVVFRLNLGGQPTPEVAYGQISCALQAAFTQLAAGDTDGYRESVAHARRVYDAYQKDVPARMSLPEFAIPMRDTVSYLLAKPSIVGVSMSLLTRADLYARLDDQMQRMVYDLVEDQLRRQCQQAGLDFAKSFPAPPGLDEYRSQRAAPGG
jgi:hypothetical protein